MHGPVCGQQVQAPPTAIVAVASSGVLRRKSRLSTESSIIVYSILPHCKRGRCKGHSSRCEPVSHEWIDTQKTEPEAGGCKQATCDVLLPCAFADTVLTESQQGGVFKPLKKRAA
jgi:hypothetical protein